jgi:hypothetical protein
VGNEFLFEQTTKNLIDLLKDTIKNFTESYNTAHGHYQVQPLFTIISPKLELLKSISKFCNYQVRNEMVSLCKELCNAIADSKPIKSIDFYEFRDKKKIGYYVSFNEEYMLDLEEAKNSGIKEVRVIVLKSNLFNLPPNSQKYRNYSDKALIKNISLQDFFESVCPGEYAIFEEYIGRFNYEAELMLGLTITPIPTKKALEQKWKKIKVEISSFFFEDRLKENFKDDEIITLKENFIKNNLLSVSKTPYIDSFVSSEWYYDMLKNTDTEMEQTAIVAGYLKSIEQLLFAMMLSKCENTEFKLRVKKANKTEEDYIPLTKDNGGILLTMAGSLLTSIDINFKKKLDEVYITQVLGMKVQKFLHDFFERTRNGYLHKDNIYTTDDIVRIRKETYCALFLLGSTFKFDINNI